MKRSSGKIYLISFAVILTLSLVFLHPAAFAQYTFTTIDFPGAPKTVVHGINNSGQIVGNFGDWSGGPSGPGDHAFLYDGGVFTQIDAPGALLTVALGINDLGQIVGFFEDNSSGVHGFLYEGGVLTQFDYPGTSSGTVVHGINNSGQIVLSNSPHGFLYDGGVFTQINVPGADYYTEVSGINDSSQIVGGFHYTTGIQHGFLYDGGVFTQIDGPGSSLPGVFGTYALGINNSGQIVGFFQTEGEHGFLYEGGVFKNIDPPGASYTIAYGINDSGAYSDDIGHLNRRKPASQSGGFRPAVPRDSGHPVGAERRWS